jgi:hypothetical protein
MFDDFLENDGAFDKLFGAALAWERVQHQADASGQGQQQVFNQPTTAAPVSDPKPASIESGLSMPVMVGAGVVGVALLVILLRK